VDLLLRHGWLIDGTGGNGRAADVAVTGARISAIGAPGELTAGPETEVVDLSGLVLAPGFIDVHTHYDAQVLWDGDFTPSCWHGVTSVIMGNCGFGVAPTRPEHREIVIRTLQNVEGMSIDALNSGIDWCFQTYPEYLSAIGQRPKRLNVGAFVGHSALRLFVLGGEERPATSDEVETMRRILREAVDAGAMGFSTSRSASHQGAFGRPVPSRFAEVDEVFALASVLGEAGRGVLQATAGPDMFIEQFAQLSERFGIPVTWTALLARSERPGGAVRTIERAAALPGEVYPQVACREIVMQVTLAEPAPLAEVDEWKEVLARPREERTAIYSDSQWRDRARQPTLAKWKNRWPRVSVQETLNHEDLIGMPLDQLALSRGTTPFDLMLDIAVDDAMSTRFRVVMDNDGEAELGQLLADKRALLGLSDAGAHATQLCDACFSTHLLGHWVRERNALSLEDAVWRLSGHPAKAFRIPERGLVREGYFADLVAFDPATVGTTPSQRVYDQPGGSDRLVVNSTGIEHMWVNGVAARQAGADVPGAAAGRMLRSGEL
jgi:N-acyl-D-amino-acid deacylase